MKQNTNSTIGKKIEYIPSGFKSIVDKNMNFGEVDLVARDKINELIEAHNRSIKSNIKGSKNG